MVDVNLIDLKEFCFRGGVPTKSTPVSQALISHASGRPGEI